MTKILQSDELYEKIKSQLLEKVKKRKVVPKLAILRIGENPADLAYERGILKSAQLIGIPVDVHTFSQEVTQNEFLQEIEHCNREKEVGGILIFRPLPEHFEESIINNAIDPEKDVDCMCDANKAKVYSGDISGFIPLAPKAAILLAEHYGICWKGKKCTIINHSNVVGKPLAMMLLAKWATVTLCHVETKNLKEHTQNADIVFTAMGRAESLDSSYFHKNSIILDIGLGRNQEGKMRGDLDEKKIMGHVEAFSPVPGGVGKITNLLLLQNVLSSCGCEESL